MRVLFVVEYFPLPHEGRFAITGGVEAMVLAYARWIAHGHDLRIVTNRRQERDGVHAERFEIVQCGRLGRYTQRGQLLRRASFMRKAVEHGTAFRPDVVVGWNFVSYGPAHAIARRCGAPSVAVYHNVYAGRWTQFFGIGGLAGELLERRVLRRDWTRFTANSDWTRHLLVKQGVPAERVAVIPPIVEVGNAALRRTDRREPKIIVASRFVNYKRVDLVLDAFAQLAVQRADLRLVCVGSGPEETRLRRRAAMLGIADRVAWRAWVSGREELLAMMAEAVVYASASEVEGFGMTVVESAALGVPYVAADIPGVKYATQGGQGGTLFPAGDAAACAKAVDQYLREAAFRKRKAAEGLALAQNYRAEVVGPQFDAVLRAAR